MLSTGCARQFASGADAEVATDASVGRDASIDARPPVGRDAEADALVDARPDATPDPCILNPMCSPGAHRTDSCGACGSGSQSFICGEDCQWTPSGGCVGEDTGFPYRPDDPTALVCPPYNWPAVYFSPHPDDETIGMAGSIRQHVEAGRDVFVELLTHGEASGVRTVLADGGTCAWHPGSHAYTLTPAELGDARILEFLQAVTTLGVRGVFISDFPDGSLLRTDVDTRVQHWLSLSVPVSLKSPTGGVHDPASGAGHPDHQATWDALVGSGAPDVRGYLVYHYFYGNGVDYSTRDITPWCGFKQAALGSYQVWDPSAGRYAVGYHSVATIIDIASAGCEEYVVMP